MEHMNSAQVSLTTASDASIFGAILVIALLVGVLILQRG